MGHAECTTVEGKASITHWAKLCGAARPIYLTVYCLKHLVHLVPVSQIWHQAYEARAMRERQQQQQRSSVQ